MRYPALQILAASTLALSLLSGCAGSSGVRVTEGDEQIGSAPTGRVFVTTNATVVHVNENDRLATIKNARDFSEYTFLRTQDRLGNQTALLKTRSNRSVGLRTADILEGTPSINNTALPVGKAEAKQLEKMYRDPTE